MIGAHNDRGMTPTIAMTGYSTSEAPSTPPLIQVANQGKMHVCLFLGIDTTLPGTSVSPSAHNPTTHIDLDMGASRP